MHTPVYTEVTLEEHNRRVLEDLDFFARADASDEPARAHPFRSVQPARSAMPAGTGAAGARLGGIQNARPRPTPTT